MNLDEITPRRGNRLCRSRLFPRINSSSSTRRAFGKPWKVARPPEAGLCTTNTRETRKERFGGRYSKSKRGVSKSSPTSSVPAFFVMLTGTTKKQPSSSSSTSTARLSDSHYENLPKREVPRSLATPSSDQSHPQGGTRRPTMAGTVWENNRGNCGSVSEKDVKEAERQGSGRVVTRDSSGDVNGSVSTQKGKDTVERGRYTGKRGWGP